MAEEIPFLQAAPGFGVFDAGRLHCETKSRSVHDVVNQYKILKMPLVSGNICRYLLRLLAHTLGIWRLSSAGRAVA